ncbi:MAG: hypothetical protein PVJ84_17105 [Desulfobacteraceae bacterium]
MGRPKFALVACNWMKRHDTTRAANRARHQFAVLLQRSEQHQ